MPVDCTFFSKAPSTTEIYTLSLHDALPISRCHGCSADAGSSLRNAGRDPRDAAHGSWGLPEGNGDRKSTRLNCSHTVISYAVFCLKKKKKKKEEPEIGSATQVKSTQCRTAH